MKLLFLDTETTGLNPKENGITQIAGMIEIDGVVKVEFNLPCKPFPGQLVTKEALEIQKRTMEEIRAFPDPKATHALLIKHLDAHVDRFDKTDKYYMVGQNPRFDYEFLDAWFKRNGDAYLFSRVFYHLIDTVALTAAFKVAGKLDIPNMKLETIAKALQIPLEAHDAMEDIRATRKIFHHYVGKIKSI